MRWATLVLLLNASGCGLVLDVDLEDMRSDAGATVDAATGDAGPYFDGDVTPPADASRPDATRPDGETPPLADCGGPSALSDGFDDTPDGELSPYWSVDPTAGDAIVVGGRLRVTPSGERTRVTAGAYSTFAYDARADGVTAQVTHVSLSPGASTLVALAHDAERYAAIAHYGGFLVPHVYDAGAMSMVPPLTYLAEHAWWRVRGDGAGDIVFEVSSTGGPTWNELGRLPAPRWLRTVSIGLGVYSDVTETSPDHGEFDQVNLDVGRVHASYCLAESFADAFDGPGASVDSIQWYAPPGCTIVVEGGTLDIAGGTPLAPCGIYTRHGYDLRSSEAWLERRADILADDLVFAVADAAGMSAGASCTPTGVWFYSPSGSGGGGGVCPSFWRFEVLGDRFVFSTSSDATTWFAMTNLPATGLDTRAMRILIGVETADGIGGRARVAGYNTSAP